MNTIKQLLLAITLIALPSTSYSAWPKSEKDFRLLTEFCKARSSGSKSTTYKQWRKNLGKGFIHLHHYCAGLHTFNLAQKTFDKKRQRQLLHSALPEINYTEQRVKSNFRLLPYMFVTKGEIYNQLGNTSNAIKYYNMAINKNKKITKAYSRLADIYYKLGQKEAALEVINNGLKYKPNSKSLKRRLKKYGAK